MGNSGIEGSDTPISPPFRLAVDELVPHVNKRMDALDTAAEKISLDPRLLELVRTRASQVNGCAYCTDSHSAEAVDLGESTRRLLALPVWREAPFFTARERAALELTESITRLSEGAVTDEVWNAAAAEFSEVELAELVWTIAIINTYNRIAGPARPWTIE
ncbi:carboxymuconolactone decarboxylase family protein [Actinoalloteichus hymeniacidonis]|uniref:Alkylhydroperoxidase AhpD family core domain n=1 Tax=Actinoalloteichus hymeniacidonis TaxID=340345 RepID=A0AAC9MX83_9PSEU|nr:carboxymuconolactone decarboxylase family protein [Actinoalloteichus hymeniacidonis]AOS62009.1 alkylhydroperoxidase AhpD family core domain [Actinoalloteichus hymeniacidonis]MBB5909969.1 AhpD family alkylhydroperoxidase [Actinoalloteichus hymeniacidonis]